MSRAKCIAALGCAKAAVACDKIGWDELAAQVRQVDKLLAIDLAGGDNLTEEQAEQFIDCGRQIYEIAKQHEADGQQKQDRLGASLVSVVS